MKTLAQLTQVDDPAWPLVEKWLGKGPGRTQVLPRDALASDAALLHLQVTTHSVLGALAHGCAGLVVDRWVRVLGGGSPTALASLKSWNGLPKDMLPMTAGMLRVAFDAAGGVYALDGGAFGKADGQVHYFAPDALAWEPLGLGHSDWLHWLLTEPERVATFHESQRWPGWEAEAAELGFDQALSFYPPLWSREGQDLSKASRRPVLITELLKLQGAAKPA
jgi:hypothetical protein